MLAGHLMGQTRVLAGAQLKTWLRCLTSAQQITITIIHLNVPLSALLTRNLGFSDTPDCLPAPGSCSCAD
jgi:hypothetical protein